MEHESDRPQPPSASDLINADDETTEELLVGYVDACLRNQPSDPFSAFAILPAGMQYVYATALLEGEVESGGFNQYFFNDSSGFALEALAGYRRFGAQAHARILREAIEIYHRERWFHFRIKLRRSLEAFFDSYQHTSLAEVDAAFYELDEDIVAVRAEYIRGNIEECLR